MSYITIILLAGLAGGAVRGVAGYVKHILRFKNTKFNPSYFALVTSVSGAVGLLAAWVTSDLNITFLGLERITPALALIIGYAGGDMIENIFKLILKRPDFFTVQTLIEHTTELPDDTSDDT